MKKKLLSAVLVLALIVCMIPAGMMTATADTTRCGITADWTAKSTNRHLRLFRS